MGKLGAVRRRRSIRYEDLDLNDKQVWTSLEDICGGFNLRVGIYSFKVASDRIKYGCRLYDPDGSPIFMAGGAPCVSDALYLALKAALDWLERETKPYADTDS